MKYNLGPMENYQFRERRVKRSKWQKHLSWTMWTTVRPLGHLPDPEANKNTASGLNKSYLYSNIPQNKFPVLLKTFPIQYHSCIYSKLCLYLPCT